MSDLEDRFADGRGSLSGRRPPRALIALVTAALVISAAVAVPILFSPAPGPAGSPGPTLPTVSGPSSRTLPSATAGPSTRTLPSATAGPTFPPPARTPSGTSAVSSVPVPSATVSPSPRRVGTEATRIRIERLGIDLPIVEGDGVDAPFFKAAHYPGTGWPGGGSNIYLYGHAQEGMFLSLWKAAIGDVIVLTLVDGREATYAVSRVIPEARWDDLSLVEPTPVEQLTVQTSTSNTETAPRFVVIAQPVP